MIDQNRDFKFGRVTQRLADLIREPAETEFLKQFEQLLAVPVAALPAFPLESDRRVGAEFDQFPALGELAVGKHFLERRLKLRPAELIDVGDDVVERAFESVRKKKSPYFKLRLPQGGGQHPYINRYMDF